MGFKQTVKTGIKQVIASIAQIVNGQKQQAETENTHYASVLSQFEQLEKKNEASITRITDQIYRLGERMRVESDPEQMKKYAPYIEQLGEEMRTQQSAFLSQITEIIASMNDHSQAAQPSGDLSERLSKLSSAISKHDMVIEDMLESLEDSQSEQQKVIAKLQGCIKDIEKQELNDLKRSETSLLTLAEGYNDQLSTLRKAAASDPTWSRQFELVDQKLRNPRFTAGITVIEDTEIPVDYAIHEVIDTIETGDPDLDKTVAEVYNCGYIHNGTVHRKAQICAYIYKEELAKDDDPISRAIPEVDPPSRLDEEDHASFASSSQDSSSHPDFLDFFRTSD